MVGYNDIEWMVADFAIARAGLVSVGIHTTYCQESANGVINKAECSALLAMQNLVLRGQDGGSEKDLWCLQNVECSSLLAIVLMDGHPNHFFECGWSPKQAVASFLDWVLPTAPTDILLPDPFEARGKKYSMLDGSEEDLMTLLFTSGSSGKPKAVAVGIAAFVNDVSGDIVSGAAVSKSLTVSYIPLSHSSDRSLIFQVEQFLKNVRQV